MGVDDSPFLLIEVSEVVEVEAGHILHKGQPVGPGIMWTSIRTGSGLCIELRGPSGRRSAYKDLLFRIFQFYDPSPSRFL